MKQNEDAELSVREKLPQQMSSVQNPGWLMIIGLYRGLCYAIYSNSAPDTMGHCFSFVCQVYLENEDVPEDAIHVRGAQRDGTLTPTKNGGSKWGILRHMAINKMG